MAEIMGIFWLLWDCCGALGWDWSCRGFSLGGGGVD